MRPLNTPPLVALGRALVLSALGVTAGAEPPAAKAPASSPGFDIRNLDTTAEACTDFYQFACGGWMARNPVPADQSRWGRFNELAERNREILRGILEKASANDPARNPIDQKIGDHYATCMDEAAAEALGSKPLAADLDRIAALTRAEDLPALVAHLHRAGVGVFFGLGSAQDFKDATSVIADADQGGLGLPDRDHYLKEDPASADIRAKYAAHVQRMFELLGDAPQTAADRARAVLSLETALARVSLERVKRRDPANVYHKMTRKDFVALAPSFAWDSYLPGVGLPSLESLNVRVPDFFKGVEALLGTTDVAALKAYLRWHLVKSRAPLLSSAFVNADFDFYGKVLTGAKELKPRWKRCVVAADAELGEALGQRYVELTFGPEGKARTAKMVAALEGALERDISELPWMTPTTKKEALNKLHAIANKVGYPEHWRDYSALKIVRGDLVGNSARASAFELHRILGKIGKPVDRAAMNMSPPTVNAYYSPVMNDINFPVGILQPPFYDTLLDDAVNFGGIGAVIGHELTHGFDDQGRKFGANGNLADWWTPKDAEEFEKRATCIANEYSGFTAVADVKLNGRLTLGENTADNGGLRIAHMALEDTLAGKGAPPKDGYTPEQRLFLGWGQIWCQNQTDEVARLMAQVDPHSPGKYRVNGVVSNMPEFREAFRCAAEAPMVRKDMCRVW